MLLYILLSFLSLSIANGSENDIYSDRSKRSILTQENFNYSNPVRYYIDYNINNASLLEKALRHLEQYTCLKFKKVNKVLQSDGISFRINEINDVIYERYMKKLSIVYLTNQCLQQLGCLKHMIGRAFGLRHETNRYDNYKYVQVYWDRLNERAKEYFKRDKRNKTRVFNTAFDYGSIMMPLLREVTKNGEKGYKVLESPYYEYMVGQREEYSHNDLKKINDLYCGGQCGKKIKGCKNGGYPNPDCGVCKCPAGFVGKRCTKMASSSGKCAKRFYFASRSKKTIVIKGNAKCVFAIHSKGGTNVAIVVENLKTQKITPCVEHNGLEIKYRHDKGATGLVLCGSYKNVKVPSKFSQVLLIFYGTMADHEVKLTYRQVKRK